MPNCVLFYYYYFSNMLEHVSYDIILELCVLARNVSWPNGLVLIWLSHGVGSNLGGLKFNFLFVNKWGGLNMKGWKRP